jgi:UDP-glucose 4-epimerase
VTTWLVTGGAGYIGTHVVRAFRASGRDVVVLDDLSTGVEAFVEPGIPFVRGDLNDPVAVAAALEGVDGVVHVAGFKYAGVSVEQPLANYRANIAGTMGLVEGMASAGVQPLVFSSSAGVYGTPDVDVVVESTPQNPESPYGASKAMGERIFSDLARAGLIRQTSLRYFNVVGSGYPDVYDVSPYNLFPAVMKALGEGRVPHVSGTDYPTPDGSCVRDYVHVADIALAHVAAAAALEEGRPLQEAYNLGSGSGASVLEIIQAFRTVTGIDFAPELRGRRVGDPARIVATGEAATRDLDWAMRHSLEDMVRSAWESWPGNAGPVGA